MNLFDRLRAEAGGSWDAYVNHPFVQGMGDGSLPEAAFRTYLVQDYLFLIHFARAYALAIYKSPSLREMRAAHGGLKAILDLEMGLHVKLCAGWGMSEADLEAAPEATATMAYTRYVLETGLRGDLLDLQVALAPCIIGYAEIGRHLSAKKAADNPYGVWIDEYASDAYQQVAADAIHALDALADVSFTEKRFARLVEIFDQATRLEADFWQMGLDAA